MERKVIVLVGPTGSGKTKLSLILAGLLNSEIISADSRQFYIGLNIGTAKPSQQELAQVRHHFINNLNIDDEINVSRYEKEALQTINKIFAAGKIPIVVGGSGLYIKALIDGIFDTVDTDSEYRKNLLEERNKFGNSYLLDRLKKIDPVTASKVLPQNWKRIIRALEVFKITGKPIWEFQQNYKRETECEFLQFGLNWQREKLYAMIEKRVDKMLADGLVNEVTNILKQNYSKDLNSLNTVGYKEIISYLNHEISFEESVRLIKRNSRRYAKRQLTWFRKDERIVWFDLNNANQFNDIAENIVHRINV